jgi:purine nucleosidase
MTTRRSLFRLGLGLASSLALRSTGYGWPVTPRQRVILDNDFAGDPDGLFQAAHHLLSPSVQIPFIIGSHIHANELADPSSTQANHAAAKIKELYAMMRLGSEPLVLAGRNTAGTATGSPSEAVEHTIVEAMRDVPLPLFYAAGAGLTDLAEALRREPRIAPRITLVWIGGMEYADLRLQMENPSRREYNLTIDLAAAQTVFAQPDLEIWQVPRDTYRTMMVSRTELEDRLQPSGALGEFLLKQLDRVHSLSQSNLGETYVLGDSPLVTLTALQSAFEPDSSSSRYVFHPRPRIADDGSYVYPAGANGKPVRVYESIDTRLTFEDMFLKFSHAGLRSPHIP